jgi:hypothetical protein
MALLTCRRGLASRKERKEIMGRATRTVLVAWSLLTTPAIFCGASVPLAASPGTCQAAEPAARQLPQSSAQKLPDQEPTGFDLARRGVATVEDAYRQFLTLAVNQHRIKLELKVRDMSFDEVTAQLEQLGIVDCRWCFGPQTCLRRDVLAYMCASYMGCRPGLFTSFCGMTRRYAHRDMLFRGVLAPGTPNSYVPGSELLAVVSRVAEKTDTEPAPELGADEIQ